MSQAIKVGVFVIVCLAVLGVLVFKVEDLNLFGPEGRRVDILFDSVSGLADKAPVRVAGVRVGSVESVGLDGGRARVTVLLDTEVELTEGTTAAIANAGILGDKFIEIEPGRAGGAPLGAGAVLEGSTPVSFDQALARFDDLGKSLQRLSGDVSSQGDLGSQIRRLLDNLEATSGDIRDLVATNKSQVNSTIGNFDRFSATLADELPKLAEQISQLLDTVDQVVAENRGELRGSLENFREVTGQIQTSVDNLNDISSQIRSGEGTIGKLVYDDSAHESLVDTLGAVEEGVGTLNETLGRVQRLELDLGLEGVYYADVEAEGGEGDGGAALRLRLSSHPRRFYEVGLVTTPQGSFEEETRVIETTLPDGTVETTRIVEQRTDDDFTITAQLGYRFGDFQLRAGLIESEGGVGVDWHLFDRRLILSLEAFDFSRPSDLDPHLRLTTRFHLNPNVYLIGGYDDPLTDEFQSVFVGAGIRWKDEDLKYLIGSGALGGF
ncbi:MAG: MlaD family protein [Acidobacteriota bacterium]